MISGMAKYFILLGDVQSSIGGSTTQDMSESLFHLHEVASCFLDETQKERVDEDYRWIGPIC